LVGVQQARQVVVQLRHGVGREAAARRIQHHGQQHGGLVDRSNLALDEATIDLSA